MRGINIEWVDWHGEKSCVVTTGKSLQNSLETLKSQQLFLIIPGEMAKKLYLEKSPLNSSLTKLTIHLGSLRVGPVGRYKE